MIDLDLNSITPQYLKKVSLSFPLIGKGVDGNVYKLTPQCCIKLYNRTKDAEAETEAYRRAQESSIIPKLYHSGSTHIIIEFIEGISLDRYLPREGYVSYSMAGKILFLLNETRRLGFSRQDAALRHMILDKQDNLKLIDLVHSYVYNEPKPVRLFNDLKVFRLLDSFLEQVKAQDLATYRDWKKTLSKIF